MDFTEGDYEYTLKKDGTAAIIRYSGNAEALEIPSVLGGYAVSEIGDYALNECRSLVAVTLPSGISNIGANPFTECDRLETIRLASDCSRFEITGGALFDIAKKRLICYPKGFAAESYDVPFGTRAIGEAAFFKCAKLVAVALPSSLEEIGDAAFCECSGLTEMTIPDGVTLIGDGAFGDCDGLSSIAIPSSVKRIGRQAFECCGRLTELTIAEGLTEIDHFAFSYCDQLAEAVIPNSATDIADDAFEGSYRCVFKVNRGSYAKQYAIDCGISFESIVPARSISMEDAPMDENTNRGCAAVDMNDEELKRQIMKDLKEKDKKFSVTQLQCRYNIGYARAARVIGELVADGVLTELKYYRLAVETTKFEDE